MKFLDYINGQKNGKEANQIEKEALDDPFLSDAIDGYETFPDGDYNQHLQKIQTYVNQRRILSKKSRLGYIAVAMIAFLVIGGGYFMIKNDDLFSLLKPDNNYVMADIESEESFNNPTDYTQSTTDEDGYLLDNTESVQYATPNQDTNRENSIQFTPPVIAEDSSVDEKIDEARLEQDFAQKKIANQVLASAQTITETTTDFSKLKSEANIRESNNDYLASSNTSSFGDDNLTAQNKLGKKKSPDLSKQSDLRRSSSNLDNRKDYSKSYGSLVQTPASKEVAEIETEVTKPASTAQTTVPQPVIGKAKYQQYLKSNIRYPDSKECEGIKGSVILEFSVSEKGRPIGIKVIKGLCKAYDREAIRLVRNGSDWTTSTMKANLKIEF